MLLREAHTFNEEKLHVSKPHILSVQINLNSIQNCTKCCLYCLHWNIYTSEVKAISCELNLY